MVFPIHWNSSTAANEATFRSEFAQSSAPTAGDDVGDGYGPGSVWVDTTNDKVYVCLDATAASAVWREYALSGAGFGADYQMVESTGDSSTTSSTFQVKVTLTTGSLTGTYRLGWQAITSSNGNFSECRLRNTTDATNVTGLMTESHNSTQNNILHSGFGNVVFSGAAKTFELQWRDKIGGETQEIRDARVEIWKVSS